jgi:hypothetical protein
MQTALVVTSIHAPNTAMRELAEGCLRNDWRFIVAGDRKSPSHYELAGCDYLSLAAQTSLGYALSAVAPEGSYTRKNLAYLHAIAKGARVIVETDDDNHPREAFWLPRTEEQACVEVCTGEWVNVYRYFSSQFIYPRGVPLDRARDAPVAAVERVRRRCLIQQGLADVDPDVDAVYRMLFTLPFHFDVPHEAVYVRGPAWCPFNSQNTTFFSEAFPLLYLPSKCSFRMTDIWRGFIAQRILHARSLGVLFHAPSVWQERNDHDLRRDFQEELPGYTHNEAIRTALMETTLPQDLSSGIMLEKCYQTMIRNGWIDPSEETILSAWLNDLETLGIR